MSPSAKHRIFVEGARDLLPMIPGVLPFGLVTGASSASLGFSPEMTLGATLLFFAGSAQLAAYQLIQDNAVPVVILFTTLMINLRFLIYSAAFAPLFHSIKNRHKWPLAYLLSDQAYGLCVSRFAANDHSKNKLFYYSGAALMMWVSWVCFVMVGMLVGEQIPASWSLEFAIPLSFLAMLVTVIRDKATLAAALCSGGIATVFSYFPYNMGFMAAIVGGVAAGYVFSGRFVRKKNGVEEGCDE